MFVAVYVLMKSTNYDTVAPIVSCMSRLFFKALRLENFYLFQFI
jgi:hypothetical protein